MIIIKTINLNSRLNILSLVAKGGETISIIAEGEDETGPLKPLTRALIAEKAKERNYNF